MISDTDWRYEPCSPEGAADQNGIEYTHATRGGRPSPHGPIVINGYGWNQEQADTAARHEAKRADAYEVIGAVAPPALTQQSQTRGTTAFELWQKAMGGK